MVLQALDHFLVQGFNLYVYIPCDQLKVKI